MCRYFFQLFLIWPTYRILEVDLHQMDQKINWNSNSGKDAKIEPEAVTFKVVFSNI